MRTYPKPALLLLGAVLMVSLGLASSAQAATVTANPSLGYFAGPGETNSVAVAFAAGSYTITDTGVGSITDGDGVGGCAVTGNQATCPAGSAFPFFDTGDLDDTLVISGVEPFAMPSAQGGTGEDHLTGGPGGNNIHGGQGNDTLVGGPDNNSLNGDEGNDTLTGSDNVSIAPFGDLLFGGDGNDTLNGLGSGDSLYGEAGDDELNGGDGNDTLDGGVDADTLTGNNGSDMASYSARASSVTADLSLGAATNGNADDGSSGARDEIMADVENLQGGIGDDTLTGNGQANIIMGTPGNDLINGLGGDDALWGGNDDDTVNGGSGNDAVEGDEFLGLAGNDTLDGGADADTVYGRDGQDTIQARDGVADLIDCGADTDSLVADLIDTIEPGCENVDLPLAPPGGGGGAGGGGQAGTSSSDSSPPAVTIASSKTQRLAGNSLAVTVSCPAEPCAVSASGTVSVPNSAKIFRLKPVSATLAAGAKTTLRLKLDKKAAKAVKRALKRRKKVKAKITVTAKDSAGNASTKVGTIALKR